MRILLCNHSLDRREGSELYVRDVALALLARGHQPIAYSRRLGEVARELRQATVPVLDDLDKLNEPPDLIHAQHHLEAMTCITRFPGTPAVYVCHGWLPDEEAPPQHPRIQRYVAVDTLVQKRLVDECGIPAAQVTTLLNFVNLKRFKSRPPLPEHPSRALAFNNRLSEENYLPILRDACAKVGLELDCLGRESGRSVENPGEILGEYDIIFANARSALEAATVGAAVVLFDIRGLGAMVTVDTLDEVRAFNFGVRLLRQQITVEGVVQELQRYDAGDATRVSERLRREADIETTLDRLVGIYKETLNDFSNAETLPSEEGRAVAKYLRWGPLTGGNFFDNEKERLVADVAHLDKTASILHVRLDQAHKDRVNVAEERDVIREERDALFQERNAVQQVLVEAQEQLREALSQNEKLTTSREEARRECSAQKEELARLRQENEDLQRQVSHLQGAWTWRWQKRFKALLQAFFRVFRGR